MELDFIAELDKTLSNVGTDICWKKKIGELLVWISPLSVAGQEKVTAAIQKAELGTNIVGESKRVILSNCIVGVNNSDLHEYRNGTPVFDSKNRDGKTVKVPLEKYLYDKMANWSHQYLDDVFAVYADLMETHQKQNLQEIKFENSKDPNVELQELEAKAAAFRAQLNLPPLVEKVETNPGLDLERVADEIEKEDNTDQKDKDFNPFQSIPQPQPVRQPQPQSTSEVVTPARQTPPSPPPQPVMSMPAVLPANLRRPMPDGQFAKESSPDNPHVATPSVQNDVIEKQSEKILTRPKIDQNQGNLNPRFKQPGR